MQLMFISILRRVAMAAYNIFQCSLMLRVAPVAYLNLSLLYGTINPLFASKKMGI